MSQPAIESLKQNEGIFARAWRRRSVRIGVRVLAIAIGLRIVLALCLSFALDLAARSRGLSCAYDRLDLSILGGSLELRNLVLRERSAPPASEAMLAIDYATLDVAMWKSIFAHPTVARAEIDGLRALIEVTPDGRIPWLPILGIDSSKPEPAIEVDEADDADDPLTFASPVQVEALRLHGIVLHVRDASIAPALDARLVTDARLDSPTRERHAFELRSTSSELYDLVHVVANVDGGERNLKAELRASLAGLRLDPLRARLVSLGIDVPAHAVAARCAVDVSAKPRAGSARDCEMRVVVHDTALEADGELVAALDRLEAGTDSLLFESRSMLDLVIAARTPGIAGEIALNGLGELNDKAFDVHFDARADGVAPVRIERVLSDLGLASHLENGRFAARVNAKGTVDDGGQVTANAEIADVRWSDANELFTLDRVGLDGVVFDPNGSKLRVEKIDITGARTKVERDAAGAWHAMGLATSVTDALGSQPTPPLELSITDAGATIESLVLGGEGRASARLRAWMTVDHMLDAGTIDGTLGASQDALDCEAALALRVKGLHAVALADALAPLGIEPTLENGALTADVHAQVRGRDGDVVAQLDVERVLFSEGDRALAGLGALHVRDVALHEKSVHIGRVEIEGARLDAERDAGGRVGALGMRLASKPPQATRAAQAELGMWDSVIASFAPLALPTVTIDVIAAKDIRATWVDRTMTPPLECAVDVRATVESLSTASQRPARYDLVATIPGVVAEASLRGECSLAPETLNVRGHVSARNVRAGPLAHYFPKGIVLELESGSLDLGFEAELRVPAVGTRTAHVIAGPLVWRDGERTFARFDRAVLTVTRADPKARVLDIGEVSFTGLDLALERSTPTTWRALGLSIDTSALAKASPPEPIAHERATPTRALRDASLPTVKLEKLDVGLARLEFADRCHGNVPPWIGSVRLSTPAPLVLLANEPRELAPIELALRAAVVPAIGAIEVDLRAAPYRDPIEVELTFAARGLNGAEALKLAPELASTIDASALTQGELTAHATLELDLERHDPTAFDFTQPFSGRATLDSVRYRCEPGGEVLVGLDAARVEVARVDPASGDVAIKTLELEKPIGRVRRTTAGIEVCGLVLRTPAATDSTQGDAPAAIPSAPMQAAPIEAAAHSLPEASARNASDDRSPTAGSDLSIDRLTIAGLDFAARDVSVTPSVEIVLDQLDVEVRKLSTRDLRAGKPFQFAGAVGSAKLPMRVRVDSDSLLEGVSGAALDVVTGTEENAAATEERPFFDEISFAGRVALAPKLEGWATLDVSGLEITPLAGLAESSGLMIGDGVLDESLRLRFQGERGMSVDSRACFSHLALSEQSGGPIERYLSLPAPIDTVLFLLKDFEGEQKVPVSFRLTDAGISGGEIASAASGAASSVIGSAVASSPLRVAGTFTDLFGLTGGDEPPRADASVLDFDAGATALSKSALGGLKKIQDELEDDDDLVVVVVHEFSSADLSRAAELANPGLDDCRQLSMRLRRKKTELDRERGELAATARMQFAVGDREAASRSIDRVRALESELGLTESALDRVLELLKPGAERKREARTRAAAFAIASDRLERVRQAIEDGGIEPKRIEVRQVRVHAARADGGGRIVLSLRERR